jgi:NAD(P)-dependent dehydrogenase (short-subunit alcohol dehydrogenase family)
MFVDSFRYWILNHHHMKKTILVTGSTDGIGKLAAIQLAKDEYQVYLHGRNTEKLQKVLSEVKAQSGNERVDSYGLFGGSWICAKFNIPFLNSGLILYKLQASP